MLLNRGYGSTLPIRVHESSISVHAGPCRGMISFAVHHTDLRDKPDFAGARGITHIAPVAESRDGNVPLIASILIALSSSQARLGAVRLRGLGEARDRESILGAGGSKRAVAFKICTGKEQPSHAPGQGFKTELVLLGIAISRHCQT